MPRVKVDDTFVHFPDGTSPEYIEAVLRNGFQNFRSDLSTAAQHLRGLADQSVIIGTLANMRPEDMAAMIPGGVGDVLGPYADYTDIRDNWQERDWTQNAAAGIGAVLGALPLVPSRSQVNAAGDVVREKIKAYHGSPHDFDRFSMDAIGTGEGAQAYGHGLYFAEAEDVARGYKEMRIPGGSSRVLYKGEPISLDELPDDVHTQAAARALLNNEGYVAGAKRDLINDGFDGDEFSAAVDRLSGDLKLDRGHMYKVEIDASPDEFLDWDTPAYAMPASARARLGLPENAPKIPKKIQKAMDDATSRYGTMDAKDLARDIARVDLGDIDPKEFERGSSFLFRGRLGGDSPEGVAEAARQAGFKGVRYKDGFSRGAEGGTSNYVVFDENIISIAKKYGLAVPAAAALYGKMTGQDTSGLYAEDT